MADLYLIPNVTIFGANGGVQIVGVADADTISIAFSDDHTLVEQHNSRNVVTGVVAHNQRSDLTITFYPLPKSTAAAGGTSFVTPGQAQADFEAIALPAPLAVVNLIRRQPGETPSSPANLPTSVAGTTTDGSTYRVYRYIGGGSMQFSSNGLMTMTLPLRRWAKIT